MTQPSKPVILPITLERYVHDLVNRERQAYGLAGLELDPALSRVARAHSQDMANRGRLEHYIEGHGPVDRARIAGYPTRRRVGSVIHTGIGENIYQAGLFESADERTLYRVHRGLRTVVGRETIYSWRTPGELARQIVRGWMESPGHRRNILEPHYQREGVGVAFTPEMAFATENLF